MPNPETTSQLRPLNCIETEQFIAAIRKVLLPKRIADYDERNPHQSLLTRVYIQQHRLGATIVTAAEYKPYRYEPGRIELTTEYTQHTDNPDMPTQTCTTYAVDPETGHSHYFQSQRPIDTSPQIGSNVVGALDIIEAPQLAAQLGQTIFSPDKLRDALGILEQCDASNQIG